MEVRRIGKMSLLNAGVFVSRIKFAYVDPEGIKHLSDASQDVDEGVEVTISPSTLGVPNHSQVYMHVVIVFGKDNEFATAFEFDENSTANAKFVISGTTLDNHLELKEIVEG